VLSVGARFFLFIADFAWEPGAPVQGNGPRDFDHPPAEFRDVLNGWLDFDVRKINPPIARDSGASIIKSVRPNIAPSERSASDTLIRTWSPVRRTAPCTVHQIVRLHIGTDYRLGSSSFRKSSPRRAKSRSVNGTYACSQLGLSVIPLTFRRADCRHS